MLQLHIVNMFLMWQTLRTTIHIILQRILTCTDKKIVRMQIYTQLVQMKVFIHMIIICMYENKNVYQRIYEQQNLPGGCVNRNYNMPNAERRNINDKPVFAPRKQVTMDHLNGNEINQQQNMG